MLKQLKIRAYPRCGIISDQFLPLDGILFYHFVRQHLGEQIFTKSGESTIPADFNLYLPIKRIVEQESKIWYYSCSFAQWSGDVVEDSTFKVKQPDFVRYQSYLNEHKKVNIAGGKYKAYHIKIYYRHCSYIDWFCVGDPYEIASLLRFCTHIGKNSSDGWGEVIKWEIIDWPEDWSIRGPNDRLMRAIPDEKSIFRYGIRPSYWEPRNIVPCIMP